MNNANFLLLFALAAFFPAAASAEEKYERMAREIVAAVDKEAPTPVTGIKRLRIAVVPFSYSDGRKDVNRDGAAIAERITTNLIKFQRFDVIERSMLNKVMGEQKMQLSGGMDSSSTQELGKLLGAESLVTGTMLETQKGQIEVNARLILVKTGQAIGASQATLKRDWISVPEGTSDPQRSSGPRDAGYFDVFIGGGEPQLTLQFKNNGNKPIYINDVGLSSSLGNIGPLKSVKWEKLKTGGYGPVSIRATGFSVTKSDPDGHFGCAFELGVEKRNIKSQSASVRYDDSQPLNFTFTTSDYFSMTSVSLSWGIRGRVGTSSPVEPYIGAGIGLSYNKLTLPRVKGFTESSAFASPVEESALGFVFNVPVGVRFKVSERFSIVAEWRYQSNSVSFNRDVTGESDHVTVKGYYYHLAGGVKF